VAWIAAASFAAASFAALHGAGCGGDKSALFDEGQGGGGNTVGTSAAGSTGSGSDVSGSTGDASSTGASPTSTTGATTSVAVGSTGSGAGGEGGSGGDCDAGSDEDRDADGVTRAEGDCDDCDADVSPTAAEIGGNRIDDNCDGAVDELTECDDDLDLDDEDPLHAARALGLCTMADTDGYGVLEASWVRANGLLASPGAQVGLLDSFGPNVPPLQGAKVLALSSGHARVPGQPDACAGASCTIAPGQPPLGFPQPVPGCETDELINDDIALEVRLKAPPNATGYRYRFRFYSFEFPEYVCTQFNDQFVAIVQPAPSGTVNGNISLSGLYPVGVNLGLAACTSCQPWALYCSSGCPPVPNPCCPDGPDALEGTGFDVWSTEGAGATSWLQTQAPVQGGSEFTIRFTIWDTGDSALDSTVVMDDFAWLTAAGVELETRPVD